MHTAGYDTVKKTSTETLSLRTGDSETDWGNSGCRRLSDDINDMAQKREKQNQEFLRVYQSFGIPQVSP